MEDRKDNLLFFYQNICPAQSLNRTYYLSNSNTTLLSILKKISDITQFITSKYNLNKVSPFSNLPALGLSLAILGYTSQIITQCYSPNITLELQLYNIGILSLYIIMISSAYIISISHPWLALILNMATSISNIIVDLISLIKSNIKYIAFTNKDKSPPIYLYSENENLVQLNNVQNINQQKLYILLNKYFNGGLNQELTKYQIHSLLNKMLQVNQEIQKIDNKYNLSDSYKNLYFNDILINGLSIAISCINIICIAVSIALLGNVTLGLASIIITCFVLDILALSNNIINHYNHKKLFDIQANLDVKQAEIYINTSKQSLTFFSKSTESQPNISAESSSLCL